MKIEHLFLYVIYACTFISLAFIPIKKLKEASIIFLFQQCISWFLGLLVVEMHLIEYPIREFSQVNRTSMLFEFFVYPIISIYFCIYYPYKKNSFLKLLYTGIFCTVITIAEVLFEKYTDLISYLKWEWYVSWLSIFATLILAWKFYQWYFKLYE